MTAMAPTSMSTLSGSAAAGSLPRLQIPVTSEVLTAQYQSAGMAVAHPRWQQHGLETQERAHVHPPTTTPPQPLLPPTQARIAAAAPTNKPDVCGSSPSSPSAFPSTNTPKFDLGHLLQAAQHCHSLQPASESTVQTPSKFASRVESPASQGLMERSRKNRLHSIDYLINRPSGGHDDDRPTKRHRPSLSLDIGACARVSDPSMQARARHHPLVSPTLAPISAWQPAITPVFRDPAVPYLHPITPSSARGEVRSPSMADLLSPHTRNEREDTSAPQSKRVWETVLLTGAFPSDVCLSETSCGDKSTESMEQPIKQGRWTEDEKEFAENLIQQVRRGEAVLPPNVSLRKFIADSLQCKAMRVSKKFRSLCVDQSPGGDASSNERRFNPLSLHNIMNNESAPSVESTESATPPVTPRRSAKTLKRSDYSQHGAVRSGRWSAEEEAYAKGMIDAFKAGYLPLHGNISLRKFLSEVLMCHPMRISKKFVGYVRKYHWYQIAAGRSEPEERRLAIQRLCQLEREFWATLQQNEEWAAIQQDNRRH